MKKYFLLLAIIPFLSSCKNTWDQESRDMFHQACMSEAKHMPEAEAKKMCDCRLEKIMEKHPNFAEAMDHIQDIINDPELKECGGVKE